jgi:predicted site-specific integrase-resolvase
MDTYLTISEAVAITHVSAEVLNKLVLSGKIRTVNTPSTILINQADIVTTLPLHDRPEFAEFSHLAGVKISMSEASRRYGIVHQNISRWVKNGMIERLGILGKQVLIDEAQVATAAKIYNSQGGKQGAWVFQGGMPYNKKVKDGC